MPYRKNREIRIGNVPQSQGQALKNIADNLGVTVSSLMKPKVFEVIESYPEEMRRPKSKDLDQ